MLSMHMPLQCRQNHTVIYADKADLSSVIQSVTRNRELHLVVSLDSLQSRPQNRTEKEKYSVSKNYRGEDLAK